MDEDCLRNVFFSGKGDSGNTYLIDGRKLIKDDPILDLIGTIDEVNAFIGLAISIIEEPELKKDLRFIQISLSKAMGVIAGASKSAADDFNTGKSTKWLEDKIDYYSRELDNPKGFTFSGKTTAGAVLDICRTVTRKMERQAVGALRKNPKFENKILAYMNRLSSLFYILRLSADKDANNLK
jgi:cob(I)alamin adenosyltransferase